MANTPLGAFTGNLANALPQTINNVLEANKRQDKFIKLQSGVQALNDRLQSDPEFSKVAKPVLKAFPNMTDTQDNFDDLKARITGYSTVVSTLNRVGHKLDPNIVNTIKKMGVTDPKKATSILTVAINGMIKTRQDEIARQNQNQKTVQFQQQLLSSDLTGDNTDLFNTGAALGISAPDIFKMIQTTSQLKANQQKAFNEKTGEQFANVLAKGGVDNLGKAIVNSNLTPDQKQFATKFAKDVVPANSKEGEIANIISDAIDKGQDINALIPELSTKFGISTNELFGTVGAIRKEKQSARDSEMRNLADSLVVNEIKNVNPKDASESIGILSRDINATDQKIKAVRLQPGLSATIRKETISRLKDIKKTNVDKMDLIFLKSITKSLTTDLVKTAKDNLGNISADALKQVGDSLINQAIGVVSNKAITDARQILSNQIKNINESTRSVGAIKTEKDFISLVRTVISVTPELANAGTQDEKLTAITSSLIDKFGVKPTVKQVALINNLIPQVDNIQLEATIKSAKVASSNSDTVKEAIAAGNINRTDLEGSPLLSPSGATIKLNKLSNVNQTINENKDLIGNLSVKFKGHNPIIVVTPVRGFDINLDFNSDPEGEATDINGNKIPEDQLRQMVLSKLKIDNKFNLDSPASRVDLQEELRDYISNLFVSNKGGKFNTGSFADSSRNREEFINIFSDIADKLQFNPSTVALDLLGNNYFREPAEIDSINAIIETAKATAKLVHTNLTRK